MCDDLKSLMVLLIPTKTFGLDNALATFKNFIHLMVPKFEAESTHNLAETFGITDAFSYKNGFSKKKLKISNIIQKVSIEVSENGAIIPEAASIEIPESVRKPWFTIEANHQFLYFILGADNSNLLN
uniref:SERPIN domain-containing protein n=1 Tax=Rhabditophanes sp. KR3021 TaxID=114890 RepID=A0AC35TY68_9BILA